MGARLEQAAAGMPQGRRKRPTTLLVMLRALLGQMVSVELRTDAAVFGRLREVDGQMNLCLEDAVYSASIAAKAQKLPIIFVSGRHVRFIDIAEEVDVPILLAKKEAYMRTLQTR